MLPECFSEHLVRLIFKRRDDLYTRKELYLAFKEWCAINDYPVSFHLLSIPNNKTITNNGKKVLNILHPCLSSKMCSIIIRNDI